MSFYSEPGTGPGVSGGVCVGGGEWGEGRKGMSGIELKKSFTESTHLFIIGRER